MKSFQAPSPRYDNRGLLERMNAPWEEKKRRFAERLFAPPKTPTTAMEQKLDKLIELLEAKND